MIVYLAKKSEFIDDVFSNEIEDKILAAFKNRMHKSVGISEINSWKNSMGYMHRILVDETIPKDAGVAIEFNIPQTSKRIDFILTGADIDHKKTAVIIELKQWAEAKTTDKDAVVSTFIGKGERETMHPSYQAWSYASLLEDFNAAVRDEPILLKPCAYLHNCVSDSTINSPFYKEHTTKAPAFLKLDAVKLKNFIKQHIRFGDSGEIMYRIRDGKISPSKNLADKLLSLLQGNKEFLMIDDQKLVYETALQLAQKSTNDKKHVLIVEGGPGTGKSVVAVNLLVELTAKEQVVQYVTKNAAPRAVYESKLTGALKKSRISNLFTGSGSYTESEPNSFDSLIIDEAHRLNEKSGMFNNLGENQIKEIISTARFSVFFIDENQRVTLKDIGDKAEINKWARACGANVQEMTLQSQFRCNGSDGYLAWVDNVLNIRETANSTLEGVDYPFVVCDSPEELRDKIIAENKLSNKARMVAGYCWDWVSRNNPTGMDITIPTGNFSAKWNLANDGNLWILKPESVSEVGCIHTCQGLELDYIGVIFGPDLIVRDGFLQTHADKRSKMDASIKGYKKLLKENPQEAKKKAADIIKNTYRTLMTRGQKGCFIYSVDPETNQYFKRSAFGPDLDATSSEPETSQQLLKIIEDPKDGEYVDFVPVYSYEIAAGQYGKTDPVEAIGWVAKPKGIKIDNRHFVAKVVGKSMQPRIKDGEYCLFRHGVLGSREGKIILAQLHEVSDPETGGKYTVKKYTSTKKLNADHEWEHDKIQLLPINPDYSPIEINPARIDENWIIAEFIAVM